MHGDEAGNGVDQVWIMNYPIGFGPSRLWVKGYGLSSGTMKLSYHYQPDGILPANL